jgi:hypothetical protein
MPVSGSVLLSLSSTGHGVSCSNILLPDLVAASAKFPMQACLVHIVSAGGSNVSAVQESRKRHSSHQDREMGMASHSLLAVPTAAGGKFYNHLSYPYQYQELHSIRSQVYRLKHYVWNSWTCISITSTINSTAYSIGRPSRKI